MLVNKQKQRRKNMKFLKERPGKYWDIDMEMSKKEEDALLNYAKQNILNDKKYLLNWAVNRGLENYINSLETQNNSLSKLISKKTKKNV